MSKFSKKTFSTTSNVQGGDNTAERKPFERDTSDNTLFPEIQVNDINTLIDDNTIGVLDGDNMVYQACSNVQTKSILIEHKTEKVKETLKGIREFKGQTKLISEVSWLGVENIKRKTKGLPLWKVEDFIVTPQAKLDYPYDKAIEQAKIAVHSKLKEMRLQFLLPSIKILLGEGDNFRHKLPTCKLYKGQRQETARPIILKEIRQWVIDELGGELAVPRADGEFIECDDLLEYYGAKGYKNYRKNNVFDYVCLSSDKDSLGNPKLLCSPDKHSGKDNPLRGKWKLPQPMLIEATDKGVGGIELKTSGSKKEIKGYGLKWIVYQSILGEDSADFYSAIKHLGRKFNYGEVSAYEDLLPLKTPKDVLQKAVDVMEDLLPYGVQYTDHTGKEWDVDTMSYCDVYFKVAYMLRSPSDTMDFYKLCKAFKVDVSKITNNNLMTAPKLTFNKETCEDNLDKHKVLCENTLPDLVGFKTKKKADLVEIIEIIVENHAKLTEGYDSFYEMKSEPKDIKKVVVEDDLTVEEFVISVCEKRGEGTPSKGDILEILTECSNIIWKDSYLDSHRWYSIQDVIIELEGRYIKYGQYIITGDGCMGDMDLEYSLSEFSFVTESTRVVEETYYE